MGVRASHRAPGTGPAAGDDPATPPAGEPVTGEFARELIASARQDVAEVDQEAKTRQADAVAREENADLTAQRTTRRLLYGLGAIVALLLVGLVIVGVVARDAGQRAAQAETARQQADIRAVAAELAQPVAEKVLADGRAQSTRTYRDQLTLANGRLLAVGLPIVAVPPPEATAAQVQVQAIRATVLADLGSVDTLATALREQYRGQNTFPIVRSLDGDPTLPAEPADPGDITVTVLPDGPTRAPSTATRREPPSSSTGANRAPAPARPATPAPAPRGLLPHPCLLGTVLC